MPCLSRIARAVMRRLASAAVSTPRDASGSSDPFAVPLATRSQPCGSGARRLARAPALVSECADYLDRLLNGKPKGRCVAGAMPIALAERSGPGDHGGPCIAESLLQPL